jgi:hypothetical protein
VAEEQRNLVQRLLDDAKEREIRAEERKKYYDALMRETMFDPETGQPLFIPNAQPTMKVGEKRLAYSELSASQRDELQRTLKSRHCGHVIKISSKKSNTQRSIEEIVATIDEKVKQREVQIERIKRSDEKEKSGWFKPAIDPLSAQTVEAKGRVPLHKKDLPKPAPPPPSPPKVKSSAKDMASLVDRNTEWVLQREKFLLKKRNEAEKQELAEFSGKPKINRNVDDLASAAEQRFSAEVQVARQHRDAHSQSMETRSVSGQSSTLSSRGKGERGISSGALRRQRASLAVPASLAAGSALTGTTPPTGVPLQHFSPSPYAPNSINVEREEEPLYSIPPSRAAGEPMVTDSATDDGLEGLLASWLELEQETDRALQRV